MFRQQCAEAAVNLQSNAVVLTHNHGLPKRVVHLVHEWRHHMNDVITSALITGPLWEESTGHRWIPSQRPVTGSFVLFSMIYIYIIWYNICIYVYMCIIMSTTVFIWRRKWIWKCRHLLNLATFWHVTWKQHKYIKVENTYIVIR